VIIFQCPACWTEYEVEDKYKAIVDKQVELGYCKFCHRKDPLIPTTAEMDKLFTVEDMRNRFWVMIQCEKCKEWNKVKKSALIISTPCTKCGSDRYDGASIRSIRTWTPDIGKKRKKKTKSGDLNEES
jgi:predicted nucleic-acid-binding Zn-ribbon protein